MPPVTVRKLVHGSRAVTPETALRLSRLFGTTPDFWLNLQRDYELEQAEDQGLAARIAAEVQPLAMPPHPL